MVKNFSKRYFKGFLLGTLTILVLLWNTISNASSRSLPVRVNRWLELQQMTGQVNYQRGQLVRPAHIGQKLQAVGEGIETGKQSTASLAVDTGIGVISVGEQTKLRIQDLQVTPDHGHITQLQVMGGQVRLKVRRFTNPNSRLEIETPSGLSGVRGTEFGVSVQPNGKTGLATLQGNVVASAQGQAIPVNAGFQNLTIPGEPPSPAVPLRDDPGLQVRVLKEIQHGVRIVRFIGKTDPVNTLLIEGVPQATDREGHFDIQLPVPSKPHYTAVVTTPLGKQQVYELAM